jgi:hypothetical protein
MMMMGQMFSHLHRDQLALIRDELERLQQVCQDLRTLQARLNQRSNGVAGGSGLAPPRQFDEVPPPSYPRPAPAAPPFRSGANSPATTPAGSGQQPDPASPDIHAQLFQRIQELQQERESHWQKLLNYLTGKRPGETHR